MPKQIHSQPEPVRGATTASATRCVTFSKNDTGILPGLTQKGTTNNRLKIIKDWQPLVRQAGWSVSELAKVCGVSVRSLERYFMQTRAQTPEAWLAELRWRQAMELLREGALIKEAASELGYQHGSTFSREFKKRFGRCPTALAKQAVESSPRANNKLNQATSCYEKTSPISGQSRSK
jgi:AraC-like DNA-binding protein